MRAICGVFCCCVVDVHFLCVCVMWLCASDPISFLKKENNMETGSYCLGVVWVGLIIPIFKYPFGMSPMTSCSISHLHMYTMYIICFNGIGYAMKKLKYIHIFPFYSSIFHIFLHTHECYLTHNNKSVEMLVLGQEKHHNNFFFYFLSLPHACC